MGGVTSGGEGFECLAGDLSLDFKGAVCLLLSRPRTLFDNELVVARLSGIHVGGQLPQKLVVKRLSEIHALRRRGRAEEGAFIVPINHPMGMQSNSE